MRDEHLFLSCAMLAAAGLLLFSLGTGGPAYAAESVKGLSGLQPGSAVTVSGVAQSVYQRNGNVFFTVCDGECARAVIFRGAAAAMASSGPEIALLRKGAHVRVKGTVSRHDGESGLVVESLEVLE